MEEFVYRRRPVTSQVICVSLNYEEFPQEKKDESGKIKSRSTGTDLTTGIKRLTERKETRNEGRWDMGLNEVSYW